MESSTPSRDTARAMSEKDVRAVPTDDLPVIVTGAGPAGVVEAEYSALDAALARTEANELSGAA